MQIIIRDGTRSLRDGVCVQGIRLRPARVVRCRRSFVVKAAVAMTSKLESVNQAPPDPILGISEAFKLDDHPDKLNLGVGAYRTEELKPYVLTVVKEVMSLIQCRKERTCVG